MTVSREGSPDPQEDNSVEDDLRQEILELKRQLTIAEESRERTLQESIRERNMVIDRYQEQINRMSAEKDDEIRILSKANEIFRTEVIENRSAQRKRGHDIPMPRQVQFDGKTSWESFVKPFKALQQSCNWDEEESLFRLQSSLRGEAAEFAFNQTTADTTASYRKLMQALETRYREHRNSSSYLAELESRKLQPKEKLAEYVSDIRKLVIKGYPTADDITRETINIRYFIKGLHDQQAALNIGMKDPNTIEEARAILETNNSLRDEMKGGARVREVHPAKKPSSDDYVTESRLQIFGRDIKSSIGKKIDILSKQIKDSQARQNMKHQPQKEFVRTALKDIVCYKCGETGHISRNCPQKDNGKSEKCKNENLN